MREAVTDGVCDGLTVVVADLDEVSESKDDDVDDVGESQLDAE